MGIYWWSLVFCSNMPTQRIKSHVSLEGQGVTYTITKTFSMSYWSNKMIHVARPRDYNTKVPALLHPTHFTALAPPPSHHSQKRASYILWPNLPWNHSNIYTSIPCDLFIWFYSDLQLIWEEILLSKRMVDSSRWPILMGLLFQRGERQLFHSVFSSIFPMVLRMGNISKLRDDLFLNIM